MPRTGEPAASWTRASHPALSIRSTIKAGQDSGELQGYAGKKQHFLPLDNFLVSRRRTRRLLAMVLRSRCRHWPCSTLGVRTDSRRASSTLVSLRTCAPSGILVMATVNLGRRFWSAHRSQSICCFCVVGTLGLRLILLLLVLAARSPGES